MTSRSFHGACLATALAFLASPSIGLADPLLVEGTTSGTFNNPTGPSGQVYSFSNATTPTFTGDNPPNNSSYPDVSAANGGTSGTNFQWGDPTGFNTGPNQMWWAAVGSIASGTVTDSPFALGTLNYFNGTTVTGSNPTGVNLAITLHLTQPTGVNDDFTYNMALVSTPNTGGPVPDTVSFTNTFPDTTFSVGGQAYTLQILGFKNGDSFVNHFDVQEGNTNSAVLYAQVTAVPEPASIISMAVAGLASLGFAVRCRRNPNHA